jgi:hypothetical protein
MVYISEFSPLAKYITFVNDYIYIIVNKGRKTKNYYLVEKLIDLFGFTLLWSVFCLEIVVASKYLPINIES